jgi:hypothetical protein
MLELHTKAMILLAIGWGTLVFGFIILGSL